jgi:DNA helicase II / ATP-dependent DNA helicase PcrA
LDAFAAARAAARLQRDQARQSCRGATDAGSVLAAAAQIAGLTICDVPVDDSCLCGAEAVLDRSVGAIFYKRGTPTATAHVQIAHELGHYWLDGERAECHDDAFELTIEEPLPLGGSRVEGYGPKERRECQANAFARTFLLPEEEAARRYAAGASATEMVSEFGLPKSLVVHQLIRGLLLPPEQTSSPPPSAPYIAPLDESQRQAALFDSGPLLLEAGPGTGKTRTLVARLEWLLSRGVDASSILILTFSNRAAGELRDRISQVAPEAATQIWAGTFHAFGLDLLRRHGDRLGLPPDPQVLGLSESLGLLEDRLLDLPLDHYLLLHEPARALVDLLGAISRAKDELVSPGDFASHAAQMPSNTAEEVVARDRALEVAAIYAAYEQALREQDAVDFGNLILRACLLLRDNPDVLSLVRQRHVHILVDEFQDVNRASAVLLKQLADDGSRLWVVGDVRQSIYRFRGASPDGMRRFEDDFPAAARLSLSVNYRSTQQIVDAFSHFTDEMKCTASRPGSWSAQRGLGEGISLDVATTLAAEAEGLAVAIRQRWEAGIPYRHQAILCRGNASLARFAAHLEALDIPVLYLGSMFERPEVRDLLSLLSLCGERHTSGLIRVGAFPRYGLALEDLRSVLAYAATAGATQREVLEKSLEEVVSPDGADRLSLLERDLRELDRFRSPIAILGAYLFEVGDWLRPLIAEGGVRAQQKRLAVYQLIQAANYVPAGQSRSGGSGVSTLDKAPGGVGRKPAACLTAGISGAYRRGSPNDRACEQGP